MLHFRFNYWWNSRTSSTEPVRRTLVERSTYRRKLRAAIGLEKGLPLVLVRALDINRNFGEYTHFKVEIQTDEAYDVKYHVMFCTCDIPLRLLSQTSLNFGF